MPQSKYFRMGLGLLLFLVIVYYATKVSFLLNPFLTMLNVLLVPFMLSGFIYYLLRPLVNYLSQKRNNKSMVIILIYLLIGGITTLTMLWVGPMFTAQVQNFLENLPKLSEGLKEQIVKLQNNRFFATFFAKNNFDVSTKISDYFNQGINYATTYITNVFTVVTNIVIILTTVPIIVYYMLKDGHKAYAIVVNRFPRKYKNVAEEVMEEIDSALSSFIVGRIIISFLLGIMTYIGLLLVGIPYPLLLAIIAMTMNPIPYIGSFLGVIPSIIVALTQSPSMVLWVSAVMFITQQIEGNILAPYVTGKQTDIHPLTTVLVMLVAGDLAGILGIILAVPVYMILKIIITHINRLFIFRYE
jgi:predicted PurR-regulated permease PerM